MFQEYILDPDDVRTLYKLELSDTGHLKVYPWKYDIQRLPKGRFYI